MTNDTNPRESDSRVIAAAAALRKHYATEDPMVESFPDDEYLCCARVVLEAAGVVSSGE